MAIDKAVAVDGLPEQWRIAHERDRAGMAVYADPAPERSAGRVLAAFIEALRRSLDCLGALDSWRGLAVVGWR